MSSASIYLSLIRLRRDYKSMPADMAYALLNDIYGQMDLHMRHWFPDDQCELKLAHSAQSGADLSARQVLSVRTDRPKVV